MGQINGTFNVENHFIRIEKIIFSSEVASVYFVPDRQNYSIPTLEEYIQARAKINSKKKRRLLTLTFREKDIKFINILDKIYNF